MLRRWALGSVAPLLACVANLPSSDDGAVGETSAGDSGEAGASDAQPGDETSTADPQASSGEDTASNLDGDDGSSSSDGTSDESGGDEPIPSVCDPQPEDVTSYFYLDGAFEIPNPGASTATCTVDALGPITEDGGDELLGLSLTCSDGEHTLALPLDLSLPLLPGATVEVTWWISDATFAMTSGVTIVDEDGLVLAAYLGTYLPGYPGFNEEVEVAPPADFFAPLSIELVPDVCSIEPLPPCEGILCPQCSQDERQALTFRLGEAETTIYDHGAGALEGFDLRVGRAVKLHDLGRCTDTSDSRYGFIAVRP